MVSDKHVIAATRAAFEDILDEAPLPPEWGQATGQIVRLHRSERRQPPAWATAMGATLVLLLVVGSAVVVSTGLWPDAGSDNVSSEVTTTAPSQTDLEQEPALTLSPTLGPEPQFDTSVLGDEVVPDRSSDPEFVGPQLPFILEPGATLVGEPLYVGRVADRYGYALVATSTAGNESCTAVLGERGIGDWGCGGGDLSGLFGAYSVSNNRGGVPATNQLRAMYMALDPDASAIAIENSTGIKQWQRTFGGAGLFVIDGVDSTDRFTVTVFNARGDVMESQSFTASSNDSGIHPPTGVPDEARDWCLTFEGSAAWRLEADRIDFVPDGYSPETFVLPDGTRQSLEVIVDGEFETLSGGDLKNAQTELDAFLRYPTNSPLACRAAYQNR